MKLLVQRVLKADVEVAGKIVGKIDKGLLVFLGVEKNDDTKKADFLATKLVNLRIFEDENEKLNLSVKDVGGEILLVSNFTLCTVPHSGNRPSFILSADKDKANEYYLRLSEEIKKLGVNVCLGVFGADMQIETHLDGPINIYKEF